MSRAAWEWRIDEPCCGAGGYNDIGARAPVTVTNQNGEVIGTTALAAGSYSNRGGSPQDPPMGCVFRCEVTGLSDATFSKIEISRRGKLAYSPADLEALGWLVWSTLGT
jgi:hypothetical protein